MGENYDDDPILKAGSELIDAMMNQGVFGGTLSNEGMSQGIPNWEERTRNQRYSEKAKTHGYAPGLVKSARYFRRQRVAELRDKVLAGSERESYAFAATMEALAYAIDVERFCGSFSMRGHNSFSVEEVDNIAESIIVWLADQGHQITPIDAAGIGVAGDPNQASIHSESAERRQNPLDDETIEKLSDMPWDVNVAREDAASRVLGSYSRWNTKRYSRRKREGGFYNFMFVPAKLRRQDVIERYRAKLTSLAGSDRIAYRNSHEALAYAMDAELFLRSVPDVELEGEAMEEAVNRFTNRILAWLDDRGYELVPKADVD